MYLLPVSTTTSMLSERSGKIQTNHCKWLSVDLSGMPWLSDEITGCIW